MEQVVQYLQKRGYKTVKPEFYSVIYGWKRWYEGDVKGFHNYRVYNGKRHIKQQRASIGMAKKTTEDLANLLMNEKVSIVVNDNLTQDFLASVFQQNNFLVKMNEMQEVKSALGTAAYVVFVEGAALSPKKGLTGGTVRINYIPGDQVYPISWKNGIVQECAFGSVHNVKAKQYLHLQIHTLHKQGYTIENKAFNITDGRFDEAELSNVPALQHVPKTIRTGSQERQFVIDRLAIANNYDIGNPMGISLYANSIDILKSLDLIFDSYRNEFVLGKKRIFVRPEMLSLDAETGEGFDPNDVVFYQLPEDGGNTDTFLKEVNMNIRAEDHKTAIVDHLNLLSTKIGFGENHYKFEKGTVTTATQVISENSTLFRSIKKHEIILEDVLKELVQIIIRIGRAYTGAVGLKQDVEITIDFDDSIIEDRQAEFQRDMILLNAGLLRQEEVRAKYMGETEEEAKKNLPRQEKLPEGTGDEE